MSDFYRLDLILNQMIYTRSEKSSTYKKFSKLLISNKNKEVINYTLKALVASFVEPTDELEPIFTDRDSVPTFFVNLCREYPWIIILELSHNDPRNRYQMALILRSLFSLQLSSPTINICRELLTEQMKDIWDHFIKLFSDNEPQIRVVCIQTTEVLLKTQIDEQIISNLLETLIKRLRDLDFVIRRDSALIVDNCSESENILNRNLMRHFVARIGDTDAEVRRSALISVSNVYDTIREKYSKTVEPFFYKLSTACLIRYSTTTLEEEKALIEEIFTISLIEMSGDCSTKMQNLLDLICFCDESGVQSIAQVFHNHLIIRTLLAKLITSSERHDFQLSIINSNPKVAQSLYKSFKYIDKIKELLVDFHLLLKNYSNDDNNRIRDLINVFVCKSSMSCHQSIRLIEEFFDCEQSVVDSRALMELKNEIMGRTGIPLIDSKALIQLFRHMNNIDSKFALRLASFVVLLSKCYSDYFTDEAVVEELLGLPQIILAFIASDSMIDYFKCSQTLRQAIKDVTKSLSQSITE